jgi:hypothetical protein
MGTTTFSPRDSGGNQRQKLLGRGRIAFVDCAEHLGDLAHGSRITIHELTDKRLIVPGKTRRRDRLEPRHERVPEETRNGSNYRKLSPFHSVAIILVRYHWSLALACAAGRSALMAPHGATGPPSWSSCCRRCRHVSESSSRIEPLSFTSIMKGHAQVERSVLSCKGTGTLHPLSPRLGNSVKSRLRLPKRLSRAIEVKAFSSRRECPPGGVSPLGLVPYHCPRLRNCSLVTFRALIIALHERRYPHSVGHRGG